MSDADNWRYRVSAHLREINALVSLRELDIRIAEQSRRRAEDHPEDAEGFTRQAEFYEDLVERTENQIHVNRYLLAEAHWMSGTAGEGNTNSWELRAR